MTTSFLDLCKTSTHTCDKKHKLSCLWLQYYSWKLRSSAPLMTREGSNFYIGSWYFLRNNTGIYKRGTLFSLWKVLKTLSRVSLWCPLNTRKNGSWFGLQTDKLWPFYVCRFLLICNFQSIESNFRSIKPCRNWIVISCNYSIPNLI